MKCEREVSLRKVRFLGFVIALSLLVSAHGRAQTAQATPATFAHPPAESRMASYWWVFGPAWTKPEIKREIALFHDAGIGRILIYPLYPYDVDNPAKGVHNQNYLSPEFLETLRYAVDTAQQMSVQCDLVMGSGWPYGGPAIPESMAPKRIYAKSSPVTGTVGSQVEIDLPALQQFEKIVAVRLVPKLSGPHQPNSIDLTQRAQPSGKISFQVPAGEWEVMTIIEGPTPGRHKVIFASAGGGGNVIDHLNKEAVNLYLHTVCEKLATAVQGRVRAMYSASFEVEGTCWTPGFLDEFRKRRGYDLAPYLQALFRDEGDRTRQIRYDYWETISELADDYYMGTISNWCHAHGFRFQSESYGEPPVTQRSYSYTDYPMGEEYDWKEFNMVRWTSSAAHFYNRRVISDEAYTFLMEPARYNESLQDLKYTTDAILVSGANRMVAHGYGYSPPSAGIPGWGYYAGIMLSEHQPWWPYFHYLSNYVQRAGYVLSEGVPTADVLVYLPEGDIYADNPPGQMNLAWWVEGRLDRHNKKDLEEMGIPLGVFDLKSNLVDTIIRHGYSFDGIDHPVLSTRGQVAKGRMVVGDGSYGVMVLPGMQGLPLADFERVMDFCRNGGTVITTLQIPTMVYGHKNEAENARRFEALKQELYGGMAESEGYQEKSVGSGKSIFAKDETDNFLKALNAAVPPDVDFGADPDIGFVHRRVGVQDFYFLANIGSKEGKNLEVSFRVGNRTPELWDPMTGKVSTAEGYEYRGDRTVLPVHLGPYGSTIVEFGSRKLPPKQKPSLAEPEAARSLPVEGPWKVDWLGSNTPPIEMTALKSWTNFPATQYFSGKGRYETNISVPQEFVAKGTKLVLDMGEVRETAEVWINGKHVGVAWMLPYKLNATPYLKPGQNSLRIEVTNLQINYVLNQPEKDYSEVEKTYHLSYEIPRPQEKAFVKTPYPSGLFGPVRIVQIQGE